MKAIKYISGFLFCVPAILFLFLFNIGPFLYSFVLSFQNSVGQLSFENYQWLITSDEVRYSIWITFLYAVVRTSLIFITSLVLALTIKGLRGEYIFISMIFLPWLMSDYMVGNIFRWLFNGIYGVINAILYSLGLINGPILWLSKWPEAFWTIIIAGVWRDIPWGTIVLLAGLKTVPNEFYETAEVFGASLWQRLKYVTIPLIRGAITIFFIIQTMWCFQAFGEVYSLTMGGPGGRTAVLYYYVWQVGFYFLRFGQGIVVSYLVSLIVGIIAIIYFKVIGVGGVYE